MDKIIEFVCYIPNVIRRYLRNIRLERENKIARKTMSDSMDREHESRLALIEYQKKYIEYLKTLSERQKKYIEYLKTSSEHKE